MPPGLKLTPVKLPLVASSWLFMALRAVSWTHNHASVTLVEIVMTCMRSRILEAKSSCSSPWKPNLLQLTVATIKIIMYHFQ